LITGGILLYFGIDNLNTFGGGNVWTRGLVSVDPNAIYQSTTFSTYSVIEGFLRQVLLVNTPQLLLSYMYFAYNGLFTEMHAAEEWSGFATNRKSLRVSNPAAGQRSTYWLSLPWAYSVPLITVSSLLHWLVSRSLYLIRINVMGPDGQLMPDRGISACGYSVLMMIFAMAVLVIMSATVVVCSLRRINAAIPLIGTASVAISAVCHHPNDAKTEACKPLLWGVTKRPEDGQPHCALSSDEVESPIPGQQYW
jgi:hypothetical protein